MASERGLLARQETRALGFVSQPRMYTSSPSRKMPLDYLAWLYAVCKAKCHPEALRSVPCALQKLFSWQDGVAK